MDAGSVSLWDFAECLYAEPEVEPLCLSLQNDHDINVLVLLWCTWLEVRGLEVTHVQLAEANKAAKGKSEASLGPLRQVRRHLKHNPQLPDAVRAEVRMHLLRAELALEKCWLQELDALPVASTRGACDGQKPLELLLELEGLDGAEQQVKPMIKAAQRVYLRFLEG